jgi:GAF domain-containing protein
MKLDVDPEIRERWRGLLDTLAELLGIPAALIMHVIDEDIEVFVASTNEDNPYHPGDRERLVDSGLYCEHVIKHRQRLLVPDARVDEQWCDNPDIKLDMVSYLGFPVRWPDDSVFGTICVLDRQHNEYSPLTERVIQHFRDLVESHLVLLKQRMQLLKTLHGIVPICAVCRKIRDREGQWHRFEQYISDRTSAEFSHGMCPECTRVYMADLE